MYVYSVDVSMYAKWDIVIVMSQNVMHKCLMHRQQKQLEVRGGSLPLSPTFRRLLKLMCTSRLCNS